MIDPILSLAFAMQSNNGVYALLLGSGVSRAAQIPTGWEVVLDLVSKLAHMQGEDCGTDAAKWFQDKYGKEPDYSKLLDALAKSREERQQLLRGYFEPNDEEREQSLKQPTAAHRAIAKLVAGGYVRVIVTMNFDRLIERAIEDEGITPTVISTPDAVEGALPLIHQDCCVVKVHGDYLDTRIKNTPKELEKYDRRVNKLLDRIFDEFGLIVCGWSAEWDPALRAADERCKSRRFTLYWTAHGKLAERAERLVKARSGTVLSINDADQFFTELSEKVLALEDLQRPHPLSVAAAAATVKRLLTEDRHRIRLHDLVHDETERVFQSLQPVFQTLLQRGNQNEKFAVAVGEIESHIELLSAICIQGAFWGEANHHRVFAYPIQRLACDPEEGRSGTHLNDTLRAIPSVVLLYIAGLAALAGENIAMLVALLTIPTIVQHGEAGPFLTGVDWSEVQQWFKLLPDYKQKHFPASEWLFIQCRDVLRPLTPTESGYDQAFDRFEVLRSVIFAELTTKGRYADESSTESTLWGPPPGRFVWKQGPMHMRSDDSIFGVMKADSELAERIASTGLFEGKPQRFVKAVSLFEQWAVKMGERLW